MSLLGIDVGATGCKATAFLADESLIGSAYEGYDIHRPQPGWAEPDTAFGTESRPRSAASPLPARPTPSRRSQCRRSAPLRPTGPPDFISDSTGFIAGVRLETSRGDILRGILEGISFILKECVDSLPPTGIEIADYQVAGGGSRSDPWVQLSADILGRRFVRPTVSEVGTLGAALIAGVDSGLYPSFEAAVEAMVRLERHFEPDLRQHRLYADWYELYRQFWPTTADCLRALASGQARSAH